MCYILKCVGLSWVMAASLGVIFGAAVMHNASIRELWAGCVVQVSLIISTVIALLMTPLTIWSFAPKRRLLLPKGGILWCLLVGYILLVAPHNGPMAIVGSLLLGAGGLIAIRLL